MLIATTHEAGIAKKELLTGIEEVEEGFTGQVRAVLEECCEEGGECEEVKGRKERGVGTSVSLQFQ